MTAATPTMRPPIDEKAWVYPRAFSFFLGSSNSSASQATAATNSTHTPMKTKQRKNKSQLRSLAKPAARAENA